MVGDSVLTSLVWDWGAYYVDTVQDVRRSSWVPHAYWGGLADGVVELASFSPLVPQDVLDQVESERQRIVEDDWDVFCGPINDADGTQRVAPGECLTNQEMLEIDWFVEGVTTGEGRR
jgi:basic membrane protein A